jgi:hypothetical protein
MQAVRERDQDKAEELALVRTKQQEVECELEQERAKPAKIKFIFYELERSPRSQGDIGRHVFIRAKLELLEPMRVTV